MKDSKIEWCDHTFNPWWGCVKVSPGCQHCYAETFARRLGLKLWGAGSGRRFFGDKHWLEPLRWNEKAAALGVRQRVFCASMADVFEDREELMPHRQRLFDLIDATPSLDWLLLTKRPENIAPIMARMSNGTYGSAWNFAAHMPNVWLGVTVEDQTWADKRIPALLRIPARVRFLSCEPLLGEVNLIIRVQQRGAHYKTITGTGWLGDGSDGAAEPSIQWVIGGGESGPGARPMHPEWARRLRDQCAAAGVPFLFKQWGEHLHERITPVSLLAKCPPFVTINGENFYRVGKHAAGRLLDGVEHNGFPV